MINKIKNYNNATEYPYYLVVTYFKKIKIKMKKIVDLMPKLCYFKLGLYNIVNINVQK